MGYIPNSSHLECVFYLNVIHEWNEAQAVHSMFSCSRSMTEGSSVVSHLVGFAIGVAARDFLGLFKGSEECPPCVVTCGSLTCPAINCTTGHIHFSIITWLFAGILVLVGLAVIWWVRRKTGSDSSPWTGGCTVAKPLASDGRRPLGPAISWRPESRG